MILYIFKSSICLAILFVCYYFFFRKDKRFLFNRFYLLASIVLSLLTPLIILPVPIDHDLLDEQQITMIRQGLTLLHNNSRTLAAESSPVNTVPIISEVIFFIYLIGVLIMTVRYMSNLLSIKRLILTQWSVIDQAKHPTATNFSPIPAGHIILFWVVVSIIL